MYFRLIREVRDETGTRYRIDSFTYAEPRCIDSFIFIAVTPSYLIFYTRVRKLVGMRENGVTIIRKR